MRRTEIEEADDKATKSKAMETRRNAKFGIFSAILCHSNTFQIPRLFANTEENSSSVLYSVLIIVIIINPCTPDVWKGLDRIKPRWYKMNTQVECASLFCPNISWYLIYHNVEMPLEQCTDSSVWYSLIWLQCLGVEMEMSNILRSLTIYSKTL